MNRIITILILLSGILLAQGTSDPASLTVFPSNAAITVDGVLDESDWSIDNPYLLYGIEAQPGGNASTPTGYAIVKPGYVDTTTTVVKFLYSGMNLYISLKSNDQQVCRFGNSWEGDGLFMKVKDASGSDVEFKLYYNLAGTDPEIHYEGPGHSEGAGVKGTGTIVNDSTNVDGGYTAELRISLDSLGYTNIPDSLKVLMNIFDPDSYSDGVEAWLANGSFAKQWWGSEWGPEERSLVFIKNYDPQTLPVSKTNDVMTIDGVLNEAIWTQDKPSLKFQIGGNGSGNTYVPTGSAIVKGPYTDASTTLVHFTYDDSSLYIGFNSDDKQVCRFGNSWEGDGLFMKIKDASGSDVEFKLYYNLAGTDPEIHYEGPAHSLGAGAKGTGTIVNDSTNVDGGYSAELKISLAGLGFTKVPDSLQVLINIFDPDNYSDGVEAWLANGNFAKQWWGSEWGPDERYLQLVKEPVLVNVDPPSLDVNYSTSTVVVDGVLDTGEWPAEAPTLMFKMGGIGHDNIFVPTGGAVVKEIYSDTSTTYVRFQHDNDNLYISLESNDRQVCRFGNSWEGDGIFMKVKDASGSDVEFKLYYNLAGTDPGIHYEGPSHSEGAGAKGTGTIVNDSTNVDGGYTAELRINLDSLGYTNIPDSLEVLINIFDPDNYSDGVEAWLANGNFAKQWWGSEWGPDMRTLHLLNAVALDDNNGVMPTGFQVQQNYPNPFNPTTKIKFFLPGNMNVKVEVFDSHGAKMATLADGPQTAGSHQLEWNGLSAQGQKAASGVYFYRVVTPKQSITKKMLLIK